MATALARRELTTRRAPWARRLATALRRGRVRPNDVSLASVGFAAAAVVAFVQSRNAGGLRALVFVVAAAAIQLRLLCNLLDGMLAVEEGLKTKTGDLYNEIPDRIADVCILAGAGYAIPGSAVGPVLGWSAAAAAMFTAYVRVLGGALGVTQRFTGPMAKQHRMFVLTLACLLAAGEAIVGHPPRAIPAALAVIAGGACVTAARRINRIAGELEAR